MDPSIIPLFLILVASIIVLASTWVIYTKAGQPGWASIVPIYSILVLLDIAKKPRWWIFLLFIPLVNVFIIIDVYYSISTSFGKGRGFTAGLFFLGFIFFPILAFSKLKYSGLLANNSLYNQFDSVVATVRNDIVFEDRNKNYGAFEIRKNNYRSLLVALLITGTAFVFGMSVPKIIDLIKGMAEETVVPVDITPIDLTAPPPLDETEPPPPPPPPPPVMETVKFTPPVVTDEEVVEDPPPVQTEETPQISTVTQEGDPEAIIIPEVVNTVVEAKEEAPLAFVEQMPAFPGGEAELYKFLGKNLQYPPIEKENSISGTVYVKFVVEKDGSISNVVIGRGVAGGAGLDKEAMRVIKLMPNWTPGRQNGNPQRVYYTVPIKFTLK